jgi:peptide/nickel transport system permease protein
VFRLRYLVRKLGTAFATLLAVAVFNFFLFRVVPGDPVTQLGRSGALTSQDVQRLREFYGLDQPLIGQFLVYLRDLATGQLGTSISYQRPVAEILSERIMNTVILLAAATVIVVVIGILLGVVAAARRGTGWDHGIVVAALVLWALPTFWTGLILIFILAVYFQAVPVAGMFTPGVSYGSWVAGIVDLGRHLVLPTLTLALVDIGRFVLITRSSLVDVLTEDYILTAKAKGIGRRRVLWRHAVPNALLPVITATSIYVALVIGGAIQVETVFSWPGMGRLMYDAVLRRDYPVLEAGFMVFATVMVLANLLSDLLYQVVDPRVREV